MKIIVLFAISALSLVAQSKLTEEFTVEKIEPAKVRAIKDANTAVDVAMVVLVEAQKALDVARGKLAEATNAVTNKVGTFEGNCSYPGNLSYTGQRSYKRVEIRGEYALISSGTEQCWGLTGIVTNISNGVVVK